MPTANLGRVGFVNKGAWSSLTAYKINDVVTYAAGTYACLIAHTNQTPAAGGTIYWQEWVANDNVKLSGDQTVAGIKTFSSSPIIPDATTATQPLSFGQFSAKLASDIHAATAKTTPIGADEIPLLDSAATYGLKKVLVSDISPIVQNFRLTLSSGVPVTTSDVTAATILYFTPYNGSKISLYNGTRWDTLTSAQISISVPATASQMYDVFVYNNAGVATLELTAWTNDTTRATALAYQDGVLVKNGAPTRRYVGSFRTTNVAGQTEDSATKRYIWNYYNRVRRLMVRQDPTASWAYTINTYRQANGNTANQLAFVIGVSEDSVKANITQKVINSSATGTGVLSGIGLDSTTTVASGAIEDSVNPYLANAYIMLHPTFDDYVSAGMHYLTWLESSVAAGTTTWIGGSSSGIKGEILG